jgi:cyclophilin family peptidyl-prolyl cis-trans isomerase
MKYTIAPLLIIAGSVGVLLTHGAMSQPKGKSAEDKNVIQRETATVETSLGRFEIEFYRNDAPKTVENFVKLAERKYFDGMRFHRVSRGFVIQAGDEKSKDTSKIREWGTGGKSIYGKEFDDELNPNTSSYKEGYKKGVIAMANRGPNTNTSQFFVMLNDNTTLPKNYTIFGKVVKGINVVDAIGQVEIIPGPMGPTDGRPKKEVLIKRVTIEREAVKSTGKK